MPAPVPVTRDDWPRPSGFAHGMSGRGRVVVLAGQIGWNPQTNTFESDDLTAQVAQALDNIVALLHSAGATPAHLARLTWFMTDREAYVAARAGIGEAYRRIIGRHFPAMSVVFVSALLEPRARVEIEATAIVPD